MSKGSEFIWDVERVRKLKLSTVKEFYVTCQWVEEKKTWCWVVKAQINYADAPTIGEFGEGEEGKREAQSYIDAITKGD